MRAAELLKKVRRLELSTRRVVASSLAGQYHSAFKGRGMAFSEVRPYSPGDDVRSIDWNVTARLQEPFVKVFHEERELTVLLLVDVSASMHFAGPSVSKAETAAEVCAHVALSAIANNDRVGLILFSTEIEALVPPRKGRHHALRVLTGILGHQPRALGTDLARALQTANRIVHQRSVLLVVSDFQAHGYELPLRLAAQRHDVVPVVLGDPWEEALPPLGLVHLDDLETGTRTLVDTSSAAVQHTLRQRAAAEREARERLFRRLRLDAVTLSTREALSTSLRRFFARRGARA